VRARKALGVVAQGAQRDVLAFAGAARLHRGVQFLQRVNPRLGGLPALGGHHCRFALAREHEVGGAFDSLHRVTIALPGLLQRKGKVAPRHGRYSGKDGVGLFGTGRLQLLPQRNAANDQHRKAAHGAEDPVFIGQQRLGGAGEHDGNKNADPPRRAQQHGKQRVGGHTEFHVPRCYRVLRCRGLPGRPVKQLSHSTASIGGCPPRGRLHLRLHLR